MRDNVPCEFPAGYDGTAILDRLAQVLDPELDESILELGFVRSLQLRSGHASVALRLPTSWCAVNFAYLMAEDIRRALLTVGARQRELPRRWLGYLRDVLERIISGHTKANQLISSLAFIRCRTLTTLPSIANDTVTPKLMPAFQKNSLYPTNHTIK
jgi:Iron-sulfur cluster assembly protein